MVCYSFALPGQAYYLTGQKFGDGASDCFRVFDWEDVFQ